MSRVKPFFVVCTFLPPYGPIVAGEPTNHEDHGVLYLPVNRAYEECPQRTMPLSSARLSRVPRSVRHLHSVPVVYPETKGFMQHGICGEHCD